jgi:hypothetical protein
MSKDDELEVAFGAEFDDDEEGIKEYLEQHNAVGQLTILEHPETGLMAYHTAMFDSDFEGPDGELSEAQLLFENICVLAEEYLSAPKQ